MKRVEPVRTAALAALIALTVALPAEGASPPALPAAAPVATAAAALEQIAGLDRYATAVAVSVAAFPGGAGTVVLATGMSWPDALGGSGLAGALDAPVLLTPADRLRPDVLAEIARLGADRVYVLGGPGAVRETVLTALHAGLPGVTVERIAGANRYETAARVASATIDANPGWDGHAFVATGATFADALSVGPVAAALGRPLYLVNEGGPSAGVLAAMKSAGVTRVTVLGGTAAVSSAMVTRIAAVVGGTANVTRVQGADRFATALAIASYGESVAGFTWARPGLATSEGFADALAAAPLLGSRLAPLLPTPRAGLPDSIAAALYQRRAAVTGYVCFGGTAALPAHVREDAQLALVAPAFDNGRAMEHIRAIAGLGPRKAGSAAERAGCDYVAAQLASYGYTVTTQSFAIPGGKTSRNVVAEKPGTSGEVVVIGGHIDSVAVSPGANDNASGVAVTLELARVLATASVRPTVRFIAFGSEEISGATPDEHHFGSRYYATSLGTAGQADVAAMVSIDMVGYGSTFNVRNLQWAPQTTVNALRTQASFMSQPLPYLKDFGRSGWSDHEQFERVGIPSAWLEWREDPVYHTARDTAAHIQPSRVRVSGRLVRAWLLGMTQAELDALR